MEKNRVLLSVRENFVLESLQMIKLQVFLKNFVLDVVFLLKKCPFEALQIINLPSNLSKETTHRYSANSFKLHRLPVPRPGCVLSLVGTNGIRKYTALKILVGKHHLSIIILEFVECISRFLVWFFSYKTVRG